MNIEKLREELKEDEGCKYEIYLDHLGLPTCGIGHLITEWDEEYGKEVGTPVSEERVNNCFQADVHSTIEECKKLLLERDDIEPITIMSANENEIMEAAKEVHGITVRTANISRKR